MRQLMHAEHQTSVADGNELDENVEDDDSFEAPINGAHSEDTRN